jgi:hypothetical protein
MSNIAAWSAGLARRTNKRSKFSSIIEEYLGIPSPVAN